MWTKVKDALPPVHEYVLAYYSDAYVDSDPHWNWGIDVSDYLVARVDEDGEWWDDEYSDIIIPPSHWAKLPAPPSE